MSKVLEVLGLMIDWLKKKLGVQKSKEKEKFKSKSKKNKKKTQQVQHKTQQDLPQTKKLISNWENAVDTLQDHPLSQARIINTQLLEMLTNVLDSMDKKLDKLEKLDEILKLLKQGQIELEQKGVKSERLDQAIKEIEEATVKDRDAYEILAEKGEMTAEKLAKEMDISRSTASSRLNRMYDIGLVNKNAKGRKIFFSPKSLEKDEQNTQD